MIGEDTSQTSGNYRYHHSSRTSGGNVISGRHRRFPLPELHPVLLPQHLHHILMCGVHFPSFHGATGHGCRSAGSRRNKAYPMGRCRAGTNKPNPVSGIRLLRGSSERTDHSETTSLANPLEPLTGMATLTCALSAPGVIVTTPAEVSGIGILVQLMKLLVYSTT